MNKVTSLSERERKELFLETSSRMHVTNAIVEKDFWVVWVLDKLFIDKKLGKILMFKGGTSLSKIYGLIKRYSEDIDLILDWDLLTKENPNKPRTKTQQSKYNKSINEKAKVYINDELLPKISEILTPYCNCKMKEDGYSIDIQYPAIFRDKSLLPHILLEIGALAMWCPSGEFEISSYASQEFPELFDRASCKVKAILAKRTFWEKATILHQEANRVQEKKMPLRYSRHYYDLAMMANSEVKNEAILDLKLLKSVIEFKQRFYTCNWAKYEEALPGSFKLIPPDYRQPELKKDYNAMQSMIFGKRIELRKIFSILKELENEINRLGNI